MQWAARWSKSARSRSGLFQKPVWHAENPARVFAHRWPRAAQIDAPPPVWQPAAHPHALGDRPARRLLACRFVKPCKRQLHQIVRLQNRHAAKIEGRRHRPNGWWRRPVAQTSQGLSHFCLGGAAAGTRHDDRAGAVHAQWLCRSCRLRPARAPAVMRRAEASREKKMRALQSSHHEQRF